MLQAPLIGIQRHRIAVDGKGITTLVGFHGCPLQCAYCLNKHCRQPEGVWREMTTQQLLDEVSVDALYFLATDGGVTFGGGEPCLRSAFIEEFCQIKDARWRITVETCLHVDRSHLQRLLPLVDQWIVDVKDMDADIYRRYTKCDIGLMISNLQWLLQQPDTARRILIRLPHIPDYNTKENLQRSRAMLKAMGVELFDEFEYLLPKV